MSTNARWRRLFLVVLCGTAGWCKLAHDYPSTYLRPEPYDPRHVARVLWSELSDQLSALSRQKENP